MLLLQTTSDRLHNTFTNIRSLWICFNYDLSHLSEMNDNNKTAQSRGGYLTPLLRFGRLVCTFLLAQRRLLLWAQAVSCCFWSILLTLIHFCYLFLLKTPYYYSWMVQLVVVYLVLLLHLKLFFYRELYWNNLKTFSRLKFHTFDHNVNQCWNINNGTKYFSIIEMTMKVFIIEDPHPHFRFCHIFFSPIQQ